MTLKILKDLEIRQNYSSKRGYDLMVRSEELKAEAVKWVKECSHCKFVKYKQQDNDEPMKELVARDFCMSCLKWMSFFNLTEEDLKNE